MKNFVTGEQIPLDFFYFRSQSKTYRDYLAKDGLRIIENAWQYGWIKHFKWFRFQIAKFERTDFEPTRELVESHGFKHGLLLWIPARTVTPGPAWKTLLIPGSHFVNTGISRIVPEYFKSWNERSRRARKKFFSFSDLDLRSVDSDEFVRCFQAVSVNPSFKKDYIKYYLSMCKHGPDTVRSYVVYDPKGKPLAGLAVHDFNKISVHLVAFTGEAAKPFQAGTGLIDRWYRDSLELWLDYIHYDHLRDPHMTRDQQGYTDFKLNFIETRIQYPKCFFQIW